MDPYIKQLRDVRNTDVTSVGGKNASLGEMIATLGRSCGDNAWPGMLRMINRIKSRDHGAHLHCAVQSRCAKLIKSSSRAQRR